MFLSILDSIMIYCCLFAGSKQSQIASDKCIQLSKASVSRCIKNVTNSLVSRQNEFIRYPTDGVELNEKQVDFFNIGGTFYGIFSINMCILQRQNNLWPHNTFSSMKLSVKSNFDNGDMYHLIEILIFL